MSDSQQPGVVITQREIYEQVQALDNKLDDLIGVVNQMVAVNRRLDDHHERLNGHGDRVRRVEIQIAAQWIVVGIVVTTLGAALTKFIVA